MAQELVQGIYMAAISNLAFHGDAWLAVIVWKMGLATILPVVNPKHVVHNASYTVDDCG